jgi:hypothetical protein
VQDARATDNLVRRVERCSVVLVVAESLAQADLRGTDGRVERPLLMVTAILISRRSAKVSGIAGKVSFHNGPIR